MNLCRPTSPKPQAPACILLFLAFVFAATPLFAASDAARIPAVHGTTFAGAQVDLPADLHARLAVLVIGFSQGSREPVTAWGKRLATNYYDSPTVAYYEMPVLASVPKLARGFVSGRIKASVSDRGKPHFLPLTDSEPLWRTLVHYSNPDDPYILLIDSTGLVRWQAQGPPTDTTYTQLQHQIETLPSH